MRTFSLSLHAALIALALAFAFAHPVLADQAVPSVSEGARIAAARDRVLPVVVSILTVRQDYRQGEPLLSVSSGSGTVISAEGHIATNAHVTQNGKSFRVVFADGRELPARLVGTDTLSDLAVLQVQPPKPEAFGVRRIRRRAGAASRRYRAGHGCALGPVKFDERRRRQQPAPPAGVAVRR